MQILANCLQNKMSCLHNLIALQLNCSHFRQEYQFGICIIYIVASTWCAPVLYITYKMESIYLSVKIII